MTTPRAPTGLGDRGRRLWRSTVRQYELRSDELGLLEELARTLDTLDRLAAKLEEQGELITGANGNVRANPLLPEIRLQRIVAARLVSQLGLPDDVGQPSKTPRSVSAEKAARARWTPITEARRGA